MISLDLLGLEKAIIALVLWLLLVVSVRSRAKVFCQYLELMTGISLTPNQVKKVFRLRGKEGVRELLLDLLIREDLREGGLESPGEGRPTKPASSLLDT